MASLITDPIVPAWGVDENKFMKCDQSAFCRRYEKFAEHQKLSQSTLSQQDAWIFEVVPESIQLPSNKDNNTIALEIRNTIDQSTLLMTVQITQVGVFRILIDEYTPTPLYTRYRPPYDDVLLESQLDSLAAESFQQTQVDKESSQLKVTVPLVLPSLSSFSDKSTSNVQLIVNFRPFRIDLVVGGKILQSVNYQNLMNFEKYRLRPLPPTDVPSRKHERVEGEQAEEEEGAIEGSEAKDEEDQPPEKRQKLEEEGEKEIEEAGEEKGALEPLVPPHVVDAVALDNRDIWSSYFGGDTDQKRLGPSAVGLDIELFGVEQIFGLPEHATSLNLPSYETPYRSWNLDVFEYAENSPMALYGTVPFIMNLHHKDTKPTYSGFLWINPSDTWIRLTRGPSKQSQQNKSSSEISTSSTFISETGVIDFLMFAGPSPSSVLNQYHLASGFPAPSPLFAMGKHQCRWNYNDEADVESVQQGFDKYEIPVDVLWLDIEHTDAKKYFTWHPQNFPTPEKMIEKLANNGRKLVAIVDPHIKKESGYSVYETLLSQNTLIRNPQDTGDMNGPPIPGEPFEGWCWPGTSVYPDFLDARVREVFGKFYLPSSWRGSSDDLMVWNDMNEPSVFNKPELTCPRGAIHLDGREHREVHNMYGMSYHRTTYDALIKRNPNQRPFTLSRSFYVGSHRYGAIWTGDNAAQWDYMKIAIPMILNHALAGISFIGADVGGFFGNPDEELFVRWAQQGVWYPFYRDHAHIDSKRREPWLFGEVVMKRIRAAVEIRYRLLPEWYTRFMEYSILGLPIIRPLWWNEQQSINDALLKFQDEQFWFGDSILIRGINKPIESFTTNTNLESSESNPPSTVTESSTPSSSESTRESSSNPTVDVYLPGNHKQWFDFHTGCTLSTTPSSNTISIPLTPDLIPVFVKPGTILITKDRIRRSSKLQLPDPFTIIIYPDIDNKDAITAHGRVFIDDSTSFNYRLHNNFIYDSLTLSTQSTSLVLSSSPIKVSMSFNSPPTPGKGTPESLPNVNLEVEKIILFGLSSPPKSITLNDQSLTFYSDQLQPSCLSSSSTSTYKITIKLPSHQLQFGSFDWTIKINQ